MDASTISAIAAACAAAAAAMVAGIQLYVGHRQSKAALRSAEAAFMNATNAGRHKIADSRQKWIDGVIDALSKHHAILMTKPDDEPLPPDEIKKLAALRTRLEILLNPEEPTPSRFSSRSTRSSNAVTPLTVRSTMSRW